MFAELNASAMTAGALFSTSKFTVPIYQREYAWSVDQVKEFWSDLRWAMERPKGEADSYFMGLIILTAHGDRHQVVDGQQRILTLTLLVAALCIEAKAAGREALSEKLRSDFLYAVNYDTDELDPRLELSGDVDSDTLDVILQGDADGDGDSFSRRLRDAFAYLTGELRKDILPDPFKRLGVWAEFLTNSLYFAVFVHPDQSSAYRVFEAINTRGAGLTTADLLKNFVLSQAAPTQQRHVYERWQTIAGQFDDERGTSFVQYIRHVVTTHAGHVLPRDLYDYLAQRGRFLGSGAPHALSLVEMLEEHLPLYSQMVDPTVGGPADERLLPVFDALNQLSVITVRPLALVLATMDEGIEPAKDLLRLVVRRIVVGNFGTGNIERRFGDSARILKQNGNWQDVWRRLSDLNPTREEFEAQISKRSFNKTVLAFLRRSVIEESITPSRVGALHLVRVRSAPEWGGFDEDELSYWINTVGNTFLSQEERRTRDALTWSRFKATMLRTAVEGEWTRRLASCQSWDAQDVQRMGAQFAGAAGEVWYS